MVDITHNQFETLVIIEARSAFIEAGSNKKPRRVLKSKTREATGLMYDLRNLVYYKRKEESDKRKGHVLAK